MPRCPEPLSRGSGGRRRGVGLVLLLAVLAVIVVLLAFFWQLLGRSSQQQRLQTGLFAAQQGFVALCDLLERDLAGCDRLQAGRDDLVVTRGGAGGGRQVTYTFSASDGAVRRQAAGGEAGRELRFAALPGQKVQFTLQYTAPLASGAPASLSVRVDPGVPGGAVLERHFGFVPGTAGDGFSGIHRDLGQLLPR